MAWSYIFWSGTVLTTVLCYALGWKYKPHNMELNWGSLIYLPVSGAHELTGILKSTIGTQSWAPQVRIPDAPVVPSRVRLGPE